MCLEQADVWPNLCHQYYTVTAGKHMLQAVVLTIETCFQASLVNLSVDNIAEHAFHQTGMHTV